MMEVMAVFMVLLIGTTINAAHAEELIDYTPHLTTEEIAGKITASTFTLQQPRCVFYKVVSPSDVIWLVVALSTAVKTFKNPSTPEDLPYQFFDTHHVYMTLNTTVSNYPCPEKSEDDEITILRVGTETQCVLDLSRPDCNGPLPGPGPYRVKFLVMNSTSVIKESKWSDPIKLIQGKNPDSIIVRPRRRRTETTIIATILPILFAILLAALIAALIYKYSSICDKPMSVDFMGIQDPAIVRYTPHQVHESNKL
ncbi:uroplakin-3b [Protobothrops mucrosquamatus]|uniref:uroplakin-3b n=1 Tax=Protobothrops mucrosquamatus TaxID=103944 RepID=UPI000775C24B|nr:uroplakin-3b [Protobothrops mucrosquamatus]